MKALLLKEITQLKKNSSPLVMSDLPISEPKEKEVIVKVSRCGVCHTELDEIEGRTSGSG